MSHPGLRGYTFHKLALDIISAQSKCKPSICDNTDAVFVRIYRELAHNADYRKCLVEYFADYSDLMELDEDEKSKNVRRLQLGESTDRRYCALFPDMDGNEVHVRSGEEKKICFLLTSLGVDFRYEEPYEHQVADERHVQYRPDFSIHYMDGGKPCRLYLEHFGVDEHGMVPTWFAKDRGLTYEEANERYNDGITWKREVHKKFGTRLIELSSADFAYYKARQRLKRELVAAGVQIREVRSDELFDRILPENSMREKVFIRLTATFATLLKTSCRSMADVAADVAQRGDKRSRFIVGKVLEPVVVRYNEILRSEGKVDFTDLIVGATSLCNANGGGNYDCIIVDEFQDISMDRYNFLLALRRGNPQAQLYCVGDDWQSIYRFSGSDMNLFCHFDQYFGKTDLNKIETTYRFGNPLVEKSAAFIQRNPAQIRKNIHPFSSDAKTEIVFREYSRGDAVGALERIVTEIPLGKSVFLLGRYTYDDYLLAKNFRQRRSGNSLFYTICGREVEFLTMHRSKGLEADYVVLLNCNNGSFGFPSTIADDPVLGFVMSDSDGYLFGEERRLFYVAMTRAKVRTIVMYDKSKPSVFVLECISPERLADKPIEPHPNAGNRWTRADDRKLYKLYCGGMGFREISQKMGRSQTAIIMRLEKLGLIDARKPVRKF
ncbi:MAG: UvrD-helicase domain-containing protein [Muribaculaceae bacterium]|nr:UvrD-helicase domain-containing protein [Muribaculaceae bacterium]